MKNKILFGALIAITLTSFFAFQQKENKVTIDEEKIKAEIQELENQFASIYNNRNADSITYYADDAISYFAGLEPLVGKEVIHQHIKNELIDFPEDATLSFKTSEIYISDNGERVVEIGEHNLTNSKGEVIQKGHYVSFFAKRDGKYVCIRDMANSVQIEN